MTCTCNASMGQRHARGCMEWRPGGDDLMGTPRTAAGRSWMAASICECGMAKSYHPQPGHDYKPRYRVPLQAVLAIEAQAALPTADFRCGYGCSLPTDHEGPHLLPTHTLPNEAALSTPGLDEERLRDGFEKWWASVAPRLGVPDQGVGSIRVDIAWSRIKELANGRSAVGRRLRAYSQGDTP